MTLKQIVKMLLRRWLQWPQWPQFAVLTCATCCVTGCAIKSVTVTAANTGTPVLLGSVDRIQPRGEVLVDPIPRERANGDVVVTIQDTHTFVTDGNISRTTEVKEKDNKTDLAIAKRTLGDRRKNVWTDSIRVYFYDLYLFFGWIQKNEVKYVGTVKNADSRKRKRLSHRRRI